MTTDIMTRPTQRKHAAIGKLIRRKLSVNGHRMDDADLGEYVVSLMGLTTTQLYKRMGHHGYIWSFSIKDWITKPSDKDYNDPINWD